MNKIVKGIGVTAIAAVMAGVSFAAHEWYADKPFLFRAYLDRPLIKIAMDQPEMLTSLGVLESVGITGHNAYLDNDSPEQGDKLFAQMASLRDGLSQYDNDSLSESELLSKQVAQYLLDLMSQAEPYRYHTYPVNQLFGIQNGYPTFMQAQHRLQTQEDVEHYLARLDAVQLKFAQTLEGLKLREQKGIIPPRFMIDRVLTEMTEFVAQPIETNILYTNLEQKAAEIEGVSSQQSQAWLADAKSRIQDSVHPAYQSLIDYFTQLAPKAGNDVGYWHLPDGDKAYELALKLFTTTDYSAEQLHQLGLSEVERLQAQMLSIIAQQGYSVDAGFEMAMAELAADPKHYYPDNDEGRAQILADYQRILDEIDAGLDPVFNVRPQASMEVQRIPEFKEKTSPGAYYQQPSLDGTRPGRFFANLYDIKATPRYSMRTLAYHEGIPGHHFQIAIAMELEGLPFMRRMAPFTAYIEGWALYAEQVAWEAGFQDKPLDNLGRLQAELFRAVRLVVDTGLHAKRWSREQAIDYMTANTGMAKSDVVAEVERYIVMPGQATAYKVGMLKILELRQKAQQALGDKFELTAFHDAVLKNGALPLDILEQVIDDYIAKVQAS